MDVPKLLFILWCFQGEGIESNPREPYCTYQLETLRVKVGGSVTIPCSISYPKKWNISTIVNVYWRVTSKVPCGTGKFIYNHTNQNNDWIHEDFAQRISMEKILMNIFLTIRELMASDGPIICCRVTLENNGKTESWQNRYGTYLLFPEHKETYVQQVESIPALLGETTTIPCHVLYPQGELQSVTWKKASNDFCEDNQVIRKWNQQIKTKNVEKFTVVNYPHDISLLIENVNSSDRNHYCCEVTIQNSTTRSAHGTELGVADSKSILEINVTQSLEVSISKGDSVTLKCSFKSKIEHFLVGIYWKVDNLTGSYAYHTNEEIVDSSYQGRTKLKGQADLHIQRVQETDARLYYCFVMLRVCFKTNSYNSTTSHGQGTSLKVEGAGWNMVLILCLAILITILIISGFLVFLKKKGIICKKSSNVEDLNLSPCDIALRTQPNNTTHEREPGTSKRPEESGGIVYAQLNISNQTKKIPMKTMPESDSQVLYATVKSGNPQHIYSTVHKSQ